MTNIVFDDIFFVTEQFYCFLFPKSSVEKKIRSSFLALTMRIEFFDKIVIFPKKKFFKKILVFGDFFPSVPKT